MRGCTREVRFTWLVCRWSAGGRQLVKLQGGPPRRMGWVNSMVRTVQAAKREARRASPRRRRSTRSNEEQHKQHDVADAIPVHTECSAATPRAEACSGRAFAHVTSEKASTNPSDIGRDRTSIGKSGRSCELSERGWVVDNRSCESAVGLDGLRNDSSRNAQKCPFRRLRHTGSLIAPYAGALPHP